MNAGLDDHLGYEKGDSAGKFGANERNGSSPKTVRTDVGDLRIDVPRDREGTFMLALANPVRSFAALLVPRKDKPRLAAWIAAAREADLPHVHSFVRGIELEIDAVTAAIVLHHHNERTEGVNTKTKLLKRQMSGKNHNDRPGTTVGSIDNMRAGLTRLTLDLASPLFIGMGEESSRMGRPRPFVPETMSGVSSRTACLLQDRDTAYVGCHRRVVDHSHAEEPGVNINLLPVGPTGCRPQVPLWR